LTYENNQVLCPTGVALSEELRKAFRLQEHKLIQEWPEAYATMDVSLHAAKGAAAGIVNVMNARRHRRILDSTPRTLPVDIPQPVQYLEVAQSSPRRAHRSHRRLPSDISTRSTGDETNSRTYYYGYSNSYPPRNHRNTSGSPQLPFREEYISGGQGRRSEARQVRFA